MFSQHIKNNIKKSISLIFILFIVTPSLTACGGGANGGSSDNENDLLTKKLENITIEEVYHKNILESHEALSNKVLLFRAIGHYSARARVISHHQSNGAAVKRISLVLIDLHN